jgi:hypothetical protein
VGGGTCDSAASARFTSSTRKGKFAPELLTDDSSSSESDAADEPRMQAQKHVAHVDKVEMQDASLEDENKDADDNTNTDSADSSELEMSSSIVKDDAATPAAGGGFTPTFSDDVSDSSSKDDITTTPTSSSSSDDTPRFQQSKRSEFKGMSTDKKATQSKESTMEVTEFDDNVVGGKRINLDEKPIKEEADDKQ